MGNISAARSRQKKASPVLAPAHVTTLQPRSCLWCGAAAHHEFHDPDLILCCACTDFAIEHSAFMMPSPELVEKFKTFIPVHGAL